MHSLYLVGIVHTDPDGEERLKDLLERIRPETIAVEICKSVGGIRRRSLSEVEKRIDKEIRETVLNLTSVQKTTLVEINYMASNIVGFEFRVAREYSQMHGVRLEYIGQSPYAPGKKRLERSVEEWGDDFFTITKVGVDGYMRQVREHVDFLYWSIKEAREAILLLANELENYPVDIRRAVEGILNPRGNDNMSRRLQELYHSDERLVAVVGLSHMFPLREKLTEFNPVVVTLADYQKKLGT